MLDETMEYQPLARRLRPQSLSDFFGQQHLVGEGKPLFKAINHHALHSMILWGPPGTGKTTLAELIAKESHARIESLSAVLSGVKDIREVVARAEHYQQQQIRTVLFVDEVHRFNKSQQDAFLPHVENGTIILIGATTENPSFQLNNALLSRCRVYVLKPLNQHDLTSIIAQALDDKELGYGKRSLLLTDQQRQWIVDQSDGDARYCLNTLEMMLDFAEKNNDGVEVIDDAAFSHVLSQGVKRFDQQGDYFYDCISALHKSIRGSDPDAALCWLARMIDGGCDIAYIARRLVRLASEDIGNADPRALQIALQGWESYDRLGSPEGDLALAQAVTYLACAPKSNAVYKAWGHATQDVANNATMEVPLHLRNAPTQLMKTLNHGKAYRYSHDEAEAYSAGQTYFPESMAPVAYYQPVPRGLEIKIKQRLDYLKSLSRKEKCDESTG